MENSKQNVSIPKKEKSKKEKTSVKLPSVRKSIARQKHLSQGKADWNGWVELATVGLVVLLILFILFGGINQRKFFETATKWSKTIGTKISQVFNPDKNIIVNDDGVYVDPDEDGEPG